MSSTSSSSVLAAEDGNNSSNQTTNTDITSTNDSILNSLPPSVREFLGVEDNNIKGNDTNTSTETYSYNISRPEGSKLDILRQHSTSSSNSSSSRPHTTKTKTIGICNIVTLAPFLLDGRRHENTYHDALAIALAIQHLNTGNGSLVKEITGLNETCPIRFTTEFIATEAKKNIAVERVIKNLDHEDNSNSSSSFYPCAYNGAWRSDVTEHTNILTNLEGYTQVSAHSARSKLNNKQVHSKFARTIPDYNDSSQAIVSYLIQKYDILNNQPYVAILFSDSDAGHDYESTLKESLVDGGVPRIQIRGIDIKSNSNSDGVLQRVIRLKELRFRYVIVLLDNFPIRVFNILIEHAIQEDLIGNEGNTWILAGGNIGDHGHYAANSSIMNAIEGSAYLLPGRSCYDPIYSEFNKQISEMNESPAIVDFLDYSFPDEYVIDDVDFGFKGPADGQLVYDAWIALGLGACAALTNNKDGGMYLDSDDFYNQITKVRFDGLSGPYELNNDTNSRRYGTTPYNMMRLFSRNCSSQLNSCFGTNTTDTFTQGEWTETQSFVFPDGSTSLRFQPFREEADIIKANTGVICVVYIFCLSSLGFGLVCAAWTFLNRRRKIVRASQPFFLYIICTGAIILASAMIPNIIDRQLDSQLINGGCNAKIWLYFMGISTVSSSFYSKLFRLNKIMNSAKQCKRIKVDVKDVVVPMVALLSVNILLLSLMTGLAPVEDEWSPVELDRFGRSKTVTETCVYKQSLPYIIPLEILNIGMLLLAIWEGWKARNVSTEFQESKDIVSALKSILIVIVICVPVLYSAKDLPNTILFVECAMVFFICFLLLGFTFVPKYIYQRKEHKEKANNASSSRYNNNTISVTATGTSRPSEYDGDQILSNKSRNELIAEVQELRTLLQLQQPASKKDVTATTGGEEGFFPSLKEKVMSELSNNGIIFKEEKKNWKKSTLQAQI